MTNTTGVTKFEADYYPHGAPRVITSTKDSLLKFQGKQQDTESSLDNVRRMYSPTLARFLPTRTASMPPKPKTKGVPPPQSLNPGTLAASNPVVHPNSLVGSIIGGIGGLLFGSATEGSEGNNPCAAWGCYPGPPDPGLSDFFDSSNPSSGHLWDCYNFLVTPGRCLYFCVNRIEFGKFGLGIAGPTHERIKAACPEITGTNCPHYIEIKTPQPFVMGEPYEIRGCKPNLQ
jgi:hypothetical protein